MTNPEKTLEGTIFQLKSALQIISGGVKINKKRSGAAQINLSALDMQEIASKALREAYDQSPTLPEDDTFFPLNAGKN